MTDTVHHSRTKYFGRCYSIEEGLLKRISSLIKNRMGDEPYINIELTGIGDLSARSMDDLTSDASVEVASIESINFRGSAAGTSKLSSISVSLDHSKTLGCIRVSVSGSRDAVNSAYGELTQIISSAERPYWPINYTGSAFILFIYFVIAIVISLFYSAWIFSSFDSEMTKQYPNLFGALFMLCIISSASMLFLVRNYIFPGLTFRIGASARMAARRDNIRKFIFGTLCLGFIVSLFNRQLFEHLQHWLAR